MHPAIPLILTVAAIAACHTPAEPPTRSSPQATPSAERSLDWALGDWIGERVHAEDGSAAPMKMTVESILGGAGQFRRLEIATERGAYRGIQVQVFHPESDRWVRQYVNDVRRTFARLESDGPSGVRWRSTTPGRTRESRLVSERPTDGVWRRTLSVSDDGGASWRDLWIDELRRGP